MSDAKENSLMRRESAGEENPAEVLTDPNVQGRGMHLISGIRKGTRALLKKLPGVDHRAQKAVIKKEMDGEKRSLYGLPSSALARELSRAIMADAGRRERGLYGLPSNASQDELDYARMGYREYEKMSILERPVSGFSPYPDQEENPLIRQLKLLKFRLWD